MGLTDSYCTVMRRALAEWGYCPSWTDDPREPEFGGFGPWTSGAVYSHVTRYSQHSPKEATTYKPPTGGTPSTSNCRYRFWGQISDPLDQRVAFFEETPGCWMYDVGVHSTGPGILGATRVTQPRDIGEVALGSAQLYDFETLVPNHKSHTKKRNVSPGYNKYLASDAAAWPRQISADLMLSPWSTAFPLFYPYEEITPLPRGRARTETLLS